jgi:hypothetical protein
MRTYPTGANARVVEPAAPEPVAVLPQPETNNAAAQAVSASAAPRLLETVDDIRGDVRSAVDQALPVDDQQQPSFSRDVGNDVLRLLRERIDDLFALVLHGLLEVFRDLLTIRVGFCRAHLLLECALLIVLELGKIVVSLLDFRDLVDLLRVDETDARRPRRVDRRNRIADPVEEVDDVLRDVLTAVDDDLLIDDDRERWVSGPINSRCLAVILSLNS